MTQKKRKKTITTTRRENKNRMEYKDNMSSYWTRTNQPMVDYQTILKMADIYSLEELYVFRFDCYMKIKVYRIFMLLSKLFYFYLSKKRFIIE